MMASNQVQEYDIVIIGGGLVGTTLACALGTSERSDNAYRIAVVEAQTPVVQPGDEYDLRVSAITPASRNIFQAIGAWPAMEKFRISPFREMHVWDATGSGSIHFDSADIGVPELGYIIENRVMLVALQQRMAQMTNITRFSPARLADLDIQESVARIELEDGTQLNSKLVVGADGAGSRVRQLAKIDTRGWSYDQQAVVATVRTEKSHRETAWQRFLPTGPLAFLPLDDEHHCSIVWSTEPDHAEALVAMPELEFLDALHTAFGDPLGDLQQVGPRASFPLRLQHALHYVQPRLALIGDAAHTVHPLAGQGVNLGLADVSVLAEVLWQDMACLPDPGRFRVLRRYERWRKGDNLSMMMTFDALKRLFGSRAGPLGWLRNTGLMLTDRAPVVKHMLIRHSLGVHLDAARLSRGESLGYPNVPL